MSASFSRLLAAEIDGRTQTIRYRQLQLRKLHDVLIANKSEVRNAIIADSGHTTAEADVEFLLAVSELKKHYLSLNLEQSLEEEYRVAKGKDAPNRRVGAGIVYIVPANYTLFYSVISPLSAAIAAGNCVIVELPNNVLAVTALLRNWLRETLDQDTFAISGSRPEEPEFLSHHVQVLQDGTDEPAAPSSIRWVSPVARSVAIVDRTADLDTAASALVTARFSFGGKSPYAPDLVLVNEFVMKDFLNAVLRYSTKYLAEQNGSTECQHGARRGDEAKDLIDEARRQDGTRIVVSGANGTVLEIKNRSSPLLSKGISTPLLIIHPIRSLDDAITVATPTSKPLLSTLIFAAPPEAKYLSHFIPAYLSLCNTLPIELLVGPAGPLHSTPSISPRYTPELFSTPRPQYANLPNTYSPLLRRAIRDGSAPDMSQIAGLALAPLPPSDQRKGGAIGFFEQGLITGGLTIILPVMTVAATGLFFGVRQGLFFGVRQGLRLVMR